MTRRRRRGCSPGRAASIAGMARELFDTEPVFAETVDSVRGRGRRRARKTFAGRHFRCRQPDSEETLRQTSYAQPALFAVEMGLARLWQSWGFEPDVVLGHSVGQYSAACVAGVFSLEDGALLMAERGRLFGSLPAGGRMVAVFAAAERVEKPDRRVPEPVGGRLQRRQHRAVRTRSRIWSRRWPRLTADGVRCDWLDTSHAFHSALLDPILDEFESYANQFELRFAATDFGVQPHRRRARQKRETRWRLLAPPRAAAGRVRQECAHTGRSELQGAAGDRPATGAHRRGPAGMARPGHRTAGDRVVASRTPPTTARSPKRLADAYVAGPPARLRCCPAGTGTKARPAHLSVPASSVLVPRQSGPGAEAQRPVRRRPTHRNRPASRGRPDRRTRRAARRCGRRSADRGCADKACGTTQPTAQERSPSRTRATRFAGRNPLPRLRCASRRGVDLAPHRR